MSSTSSGVVIWLTGLSGAGKTTIGHEVVRILRARNTDVVFLDGDIFRAILANDVGHDKEGRFRNALRLAKMTKFLSDQGVTVVCATMSLFPEIWSWNRAELQNYFQVYVKVPLETVRARDPKGIYKRAEQGLIKDVIGFDLPFVAPVGSDLEIENGDSDREEITRRATSLVDRAREQFPFL